MFIESQTIESHFLYLTYTVVPNLVNRQFRVDSPDKLWATDITYLWTMKGWVYLAVVLDLFSRQVVGWATAKHMKVRLTLDALAMAYWRRKPNPGLTHHSDRGFSMRVIDINSNWNSTR